MAWLWQLGVRGINILSTELGFTKAKGRGVVGSKEGILVEALEAEMVVRGSDAGLVN